MDSLDDLRDAYPGWEFGVQWTTRASGPDIRQLYAKRRGVRLIAFDNAGLVRLLAEQGVFGRPLEVSKKSE